MSICTSAIITSLLKGTPRGQRSRHSVARGGVRDREDLVQLQVNRDQLEVVPVRPVTQEVARVVQLDRRVDQILIIPVETSRQTGMIAAVTWSKNFVIRRQALGCIHSVMMHRLTA